MKNEDIEKILLNDADYDKIVKKKIEKDFNDEISKKNSTSKYIIDIKKVPKEKIFSKNAIFEVINNVSKTKSYINGIQAEGYLGANNSERQKIVSGQTDSFVAENVYVKFYKLKV